MQTNQYGHRRTFYYGLTFSFHLAFCLYVCQSINAPIYHIILCSSATVRDSVYHRQRSEWRRYHIDYNHTHLIEIFYPNASLTKHSCRSIRCSMRTTKHGWSLYRDIYTIVFWYNPTKHCRIWTLCVINAIYIIFFYVRLFIVSFYNDFWWIWDFCIVNHAIWSYIAYTVSQKTVQICFCQNFFKFPSMLTIFGRQMAKGLKLCEVHSFSTSSDSRHHTTAESCYLQ